EDGIGDLYKKYEELKKKMLVEGLFDPSHKKAIPAYPFQIGVLSAKEGAATQDVITTIRRRWPIAQIHFYPTFVQGQAAASDIVENLQTADQEKYDVILVVRGGGSIEDLWAFNMEEVVRAIYHCNTPIITGVGHETDTTLVDYVSDQRAPTPTAAAELATPNLLEVQTDLKKQKALLISKMTNIRNLKVQRFQQLSKHPYIIDPSLKVRDKLNTLSLLEQRLWQFPVYYKARNMQYTLIKQRFEQSGRHLLNTQQNELTLSKQQLQSHIKSIYQNKVSRFKQTILLLDAYSPLQLLQKGYTLTYSNNTMIKSIDQLQIHDQIKVKFADGTAYAQIHGLEAQKDGRE
ncbi:MAG: exodeoxyribonuclease VII large subunit, partial [Erysipelotrichales bacterium]|nr:exodeoxyribonuclease VII large subunit [Erysipelotrichales bacterium]